MGWLRLLAIYALRNANLNRVAEGEGELLLPGLGGVVSANDALNERMADDIALFKVAECDAFDAVEDVDGVNEA